MSLIIIDVGASGYPRGNDYHKKVSEKLANNWTDFQVHMVEPLPDFYDELKQKWLGRKGFYLYGCALSDKKGETTFYQTKKRNCSSIRKPNLDIAEKNINTWETYKVKIDTLDNLFGHLPHVDFLKLDTQGSEYEILKGGTELLKKVKVIKCECEKYEYYEGQKLKGDVVEFLGEHGFVVDKEVNNCKSHVDVIFKKQ